MAEMNDTPDQDDAEAGVQYLTFFLDDQLYGVPLTEVSEIRGGITITPLPNTPDYILGVLNLRGTIIPVIDLRTRLGMVVRPMDDLSVIVVVSIGKRLSGLMVDGVSDVIESGTSQWREAPEFDGQGDQDFIEGLLETDRRIVIVLKTAALDDLSTQSDTEAASTAA